MCPYGPATTARVNATRTYAVLVARTSARHIAFAPRFPEIVGRGRGRTTAYWDFKANLTEHIARLVDHGTPVPQDDIVSVKFLRVGISGLEPMMSLT